MNKHNIQEHLERLYQSFNISYLSPDPLEIVRRYSDPQDQEVVGLVASCLAYGQVGQILKAVESVLEQMQPSPFKFVRQFQLNENRKRFRGFCYRFSKERDILCLVYYIHRVVSEYGSIGKLAHYCYQSNHSLHKTLSHFIDLLTAYDVSEIYPNGIPENAGIRHLLPNPKKGSACKRLNLFLRWMVRNDDLDLGLWDFISSSELIIPLDTHVFRIAYNIGLTDRKSANWKTAQEITNQLKSIDPDDPVKYDFAICRMGIWQFCPKKRDPIKCFKCPIKTICRL